MENLKKINQIKGFGPGIIIAVGLSPLVIIPTLVITVKVLHEFTLKEKKDQFFK